MEGEETQASVDSMRRRSKLPKTSGTEGKTLDRISALPDSLRIHILSLLPQKNAVKTHILSKRWLFLWTYNPVLDFKEKDLEKCWNNRVHRDIEDRKHYVSFINHILDLHQSPKIQKFAVQVEYMDTFDSDFNAWLLFATQKYVKNLELDFYNNNDEFYNLPLIVLNNSSLVTLTLAQCRIDHSGKLINWKCLKVLKFEEMSLTNVLIQHILSASPSLETFELESCGGYDSIDLMSTRLTTLVIDKQLPIGVGASPSNSTLTISAPNLESLKIVGVLVFEKICLNDLSSVVDANLDFYPVLSVSDSFMQFLEVYPMVMKELFKNLRHVQDLTFGSWWLQVLLQMEGDALPSPLPTLGCLRINTGFSEWDLPGITKLLALTPVLETLVIILSYSKMDFLFDEYDDIDFEESYDIDFEESYEIDENNYWSLHKTSFELALENLKTVKIVDFIGEERSIEFMLFLLKNARKLEEMVIHNNHKPDEDELWTEFTLKSPMEVAQMLLSCPRCSPNLVISFS